MKVLITGSTGMIGGAITDLCIASEKDNKYYIFDQKR